MKIKLLSTKSTVGVNDLANISRWSSNLITEGWPNILSAKDNNKEKCVKINLIFMHAITQ